MNHMLTITLAILMLLGYLDQSQSTPLKKSLKKEARSVKTSAEKIQGSPLDESKKRSAKTVNPNGMLEGYMKCDNHTECPEGYACLKHGFGKANIVSEMKCFMCNCSEPSQCYHDSIMACKGPGRCNYQHKSLFCDCADNGFTGELCETNIDDCATNPCNNGGTCVDGIKNYTCTCPPDTTGLNCERIDDCETNPCINGGTCIEGINNYTCTCPSNTTGLNCELACPDGWVMYNYVTCLYFSTETGTWDHAYDACEEALAEIHDADKDEFISVQGIMDQLYWLGATDRSVDGTFAWNSGTPWGYNNWLSQSSQFDRDCLVFFRGDTFFFGWYNDFCSASFRYICEKNLTEL